MSDVDGNVATLLRDDGTVLQQRAYSPYGRVDGAGTATSPDPTAPGSELGFQTAITDPDTGRVLLGPRQYDPELARFTTTDYFPTATADTTLGIDPLTGNRFLFAAANPVAWHDNGHRPCWDQPGRCGLPGLGPGQRATLVTAGALSLRSALAAHNATAIVQARHASLAGSALGTSPDAFVRSTAGRTLREWQLTRAASTTIRKLLPGVSAAAIVAGNIAEGDNATAVVVESGLTFGGVRLGSKAGAVACRLPTLKCGAAIAIGGVLGGLGFQQAGEEISAALGDPIGSFSNTVWSLLGADIAGGRQVICTRGGDTCIEPAFSAAMA